MTSSIFLINLLSFILILNDVSSTTYYVDPSISSSGLGTSWATAFDNLDDALSSATKTSDQVWLKGGYTYIPSNPSDRTDCFYPNNGIKIYGGFDGDESSIDDRATNINNRPESIISGDIGILNDNSDNCYHVIQYNVELTLDCVIIQDGNANYNGDYTTQTNTLHRYGGAIITAYIFKKTELYLQDVNIRNNTAINGGAIFVASTSGNNVDVIVKDSTFEYNQAIYGIIYFIIIVYVLFIVIICNKRCI